MNKAILILILLPMFSQGQDFQKLIKEYEKYCAEKVADTITQHGTITETLKDVGNGYYQIKLDTTWSKPNCPEFKTPINYNSGYIIWDGDITLTGTTSLYTAGAIVGTEEAEKKTRSVTRQYICECKRREVEPFSNHFWEWIKKL